MKTSRIVFGAAVLGGWMISSPALHAQDWHQRAATPPPPHQHEAPGGARPGAPGRAFGPQAMEDRPMWRRMMGRPDGNAKKPEAAPEKRPSAAAEAGPGPNRSFQNQRGGNGWMGMRPGGMAMGRGGMGMRQGGFGMKRGGFGMNRGGFGMNRGGFGMNRGGFGMRPGGMGMGPGSKDVKPGGMRQDAAAQPAMEKARHLKQAAEHLKAAGFQEQAEKADKEATRLEAEARHNSETKGAPDNNGDMEKMRRELDELRGQLRRFRAEAESRQGNPPAAPAPPLSHEHEQGR